MLFRSDSLDIECIEVLPQHWEKYLGLIGEDKQTSVRLAMNLFSDKKELFYRQNKKDKSKIILLDGRAYASLIAYYGVKKISNREK